MVDGDDAPQGSRAIADELRRQIEEGSYGPGDKLKSVRELMTEYDVASGTAQAALRLLQSLGLVDVRGRSGTYVRDRNVSLADDLPRLRAELAEVREQVRRSRATLSKAERALGEIVERLPPEVPSD